MKHSTFLARLGCVCGLVLVALNAQAQGEELRIGYINPQMVVNKANVSQAAKDRMVQKFGKREKELLDAKAALKAKSEQLERDAPTLSESQRQARTKQLLEADRELQRTERAFREDVQQAQNDEMQQINQLVSNAIRQVAEQEKLSLVLQEVVYASPKLDITEKVVKLLNSSK